MPQTKRVLIACIAVGCLLVIVGAIKGLREDMDDASNLGQLPAQMAHNYDPLKQPELGTKEWFKQTSKFTTYKKPIPGTKIDVLLSLSSIQPDDSSDFYLDNLSVNFFGEQNGEQVQVRSYPVVTDMDIYGTTYQTSRVRLEVCRYSFWNRLFGAKTDHDCSGEYSVYEFKLFSNAPIQEVPV